MNAERADNTPPQAEPGRQIADAFARRRDARVAALRAMRDDLAARLLRMRVAGAELDAALGLTREGSC